MRSNFKHFAEPSNQNIHKNMKKKSLLILIAIILVIFYQINKKHESNQIVKNNKGINFNSTKKESWTNVSSSTDKVEIRTAKSQNVIQSDGDRSPIVGENFDGPYEPEDDAGKKWFEKFRAKNVKFDYKVENNQILFSDFFINEKRYHHDYTLGDAPYLYWLGFTNNNYLYLFSIYAERSQRHCQLERFVLDEDNVVERSSEFTATFPKRGVKVCQGMHYPGGFIFDRNEETITRIGVIMPPVYLEDIYEAARQADPDNFPGKDQGGEVLISHGEFNKLTPAEQRKYIQEIEMNENYAVLMKTNKEPFPEKIRVAWFNIAEDGSLKLPEIKK
jgi:hypothetical protein